MKTHLNLTTSDLERSAEFYRVLLNAEPAKRFHDYALFVTDEPGLELALDSGMPRRSESAHYGIAVDTVEQVDAAIARLQGAGFTTDVARDDTCCYARQDKVWVSDPDGRRWEVYAVLEETEDRYGGGSACCASRA